jgi:hypothetical protein
VKDHIFREIEEVGVDFEDPRLEGQDREEEGEGQQKHEGNARVPDNEGVFIRLGGTCRIGEELLKRRLLLLTVDKFEVALFQVLTQLI